MNTQRGSAHAIVIIVLVVGLLGALGYIFWQNFLDKPAETANNAGKQQVDEKSQALKTGSFGEPFGVDVSFKYPENWTLTQSVQGPVPAVEGTGTGENITLTHEDGVYSVRFEVMNGGIGGVCYSDSAGLVKKFAYENLANFPDVSFVKAVTTDYETGKFLVEARLYKANDVFKPAEIKAGDSVCDLAQSYNFDIGSDIRNPINVVDASISHKEAVKSGYSSVNAANNALSGDVYEEAKAILLSVSLNK